VWDLPREKVEHTIRSAFFEKGIINLMEIPYMKMVAVGS
jgi:hypothetical protein